MKSFFAISAMVFALSLTVPPHSYAQDATPAPVVSVAPPAAAPVMGAAAVIAPPAVATPVAQPAFLTNVTKAVGAIPLSIPTWILAVLAFLAELCMRFFPTVKPVSIFLVASAFCATIGTGFQKISNLLDLVIQNIKTGSST